MANFQQVAFGEMKESYPVRENIPCKYVLSASFEPNDRDWIGFYKVGWKSANDFVTYVWAIKPENYSPGCEVKNTISFSAANIPSDLNDFYQFCYVSSSGQVCGVSTPFQFHTSQVMADEFAELEVVDPDSAGVIVGKTRNEVLEEQLAIARDRNMQLEKDIETLRTDLLNERTVNGEEQKSLKELLLTKTRIIDELTNENEKEKSTCEEERKKNDDLIQKLEVTECELSTVKIEFSEKLQQFELNQPSDVQCPTEKILTDVLLPSDEGQKLPSDVSNTELLSGESQAEKGSESTLLSLAGSFLKHLRHFDPFSELDQTETGEDEEPVEMIKENNEGTEGSSLSSIHLCPVCNIGHTSESELQEHIETHLGEVCPICYVQFDKGYPWENITDHVNRHLDQQAPEM